MTENVVLVSGGVDSAVTLAEADKRGDITTLHYKYGQHTDSKEQECARLLSDHYNTDHIEIDLRGVFSRFRGGLTGDADLSEHYDADGVATSYVPMRNTVFLSIAAGIGENYGASDLWYGPNLEDREGYADCRDEYANALENALSLGTDRIDFRVHRPVVDLEKHEIISRGEELGVPFRYTWSCYQDTDEPCGECASCAERRRGFREAGVSDPVH